MTGPAVVHESGSVVIVDKPHGWLTIPGRAGAADPRPVLSRHLEERYGARIWIVHRLDRGVSGLVLFARDAGAHRLLCGWLERHEIVKEYEAWTGGSPPGAPDAVWEGWLIQGKRRVHEAASPGKGKHARTVARCAGAGTRGGLRFLRWTLLPETGRTHQIRCQAAARGFPIVGDALYGSEVPFRPDAIALRAVRLTFPGDRADDLRALGLDPEVRVGGLE
jgi:23S rRNA-/tRNA-specific pseudouridylate synthase